MYKDEILDRIAVEGANVAQFASFAPDGKQRFSRIRGVLPDHRFANFEEAAASIQRTGASFVNIRTFLPQKPDGNPFVFGRKGFDTPAKVAAKVREFLAEGFYVILNEEIDIRDGGFSGVMIGNVAEFATRDIPRCVEKPGCAVLPRLKTIKMARLIYGRRINIPYDRSYRVEFSVHPDAVGYYREHQIIWQVEKTAHGKDTPEPVPSWPNRVSADMGDKAYGLLMAHLYDVGLVPHTTVVGRYLPKFEFGTRTESESDCWRRTCPKEQQPGLFTTAHGQVDPFELMQKEDPDAKKITAFIFQDNVDAVFSGAAITGGDGELIIEGKAGHGDDFMVGAGGPSTLPDKVTDIVRNHWEVAKKDFGPVRFEWVYDRKGSLWIVQFHVGQSASSGNTVYPGEPEKFVEFDVARGLEELRVLAAQASTESFGVILRGNVGITSHFGDILRRSKVPSRLERVVAEKMSA